MIPNNNPVFRKLEMSLSLFGVFTLLSLSSFVFSGNELLLWRGCALSIGVAVGHFLFYSPVRGVKAGDIVMVPIWKEIETPFMEESYMDSVPAVALEEGRKNHMIEVKLGDGSRGIVKLLHYGLISYPEGRLLEVEKAMPDMESKNF